jgi:ComF family protein
LAEQQTTIVKQSGMSIFRSKIISSVFAHALSQDCTLCGVRSNENLCAACTRDLPFRQTPGCPRCNAEGVQQQLCGACLSDPPHFDHTVSAFDYAYPLDRLIQAYKFNANLGLLPLFADALVRAVRASDSRVTTDLVIALPLASGRLAERGFNQSALLGESVAKALAIQFEVRGMLRVRETPPQSGLSRDARLKNVRGAFSCEQRLDGLRVAVVDDVMTTGATLSEAAKALKKAGAAQVSAWVIARANKHGASILRESETVPFENTQN